MTEQWRHVASLPGYEASDLGRVRGPRGGVRQGSVGPCGFLTIQVSVNGEQSCRRIGTLVAEAWLGPPPTGLQVRRLDGDTLNDRVANLAYGTWADVRADHLARAERERAAGASDTCPLGHRYADWRQWNWGERYCPTCRQLGWQGKSELLEPERLRRREEERVRVKSLDVVFLTDA
jgi:hypothetical protein